MGQLNIHTSPEFDEKLARFMKIRGLRNKSAAIRTAVQEGLENAMRVAGNIDYRSWIGMACDGPDTPDRKFSSHDDLWS